MSVLKKAKLGINLGQLSADSGVSVSRLRRAAELLGISTARGTSFNKAEAAKLVKQAKKTTAGA
jgi:hypothetical protein